MRRNLATAALLAGLALLPGCASAPAPEDNDPLEGMNRTIFAANQAVDTVLLRPVATGYDVIVPDPIQDNVRNVIRNLRTPISLANQLLQGDLDGAGNVLARFMANTLLGFGGLGDPATDLGIPYEDEDFGQTLAVWGIGPGPYLVLPLLGPSSVRDGVGFAADSYAGPVSRYARGNDIDVITYGQPIAGAIDSRARNLKAIDDIERNSVDLYAAIRSIYFQRRAAAIRDDKAAPGEDFKDVDPKDLETKPGSNK